MDMVVYTGGNACSLLSDLISIQGLIHIYFYKLYMYWSRKKILNGNEKFEVQEHFFILYIPLWGKTRF